MSAYYNEIDPYAAAWLRNLIAGGHIAPGDVDERSIEDVCPDDLRSYAQCHFFAGIGVWSYALRRAGWDDDERVWTGSCPCQPFSKAGAGAGFADERHLWPAWHWLIAQCEPPRIRGEQVRPAIKHGWLDMVSTDLEETGYACWAMVFGADQVGEPIQRERLYFAAEHIGQGMARQQPGRSARPAGPRRWSGEEDLRAIADAPLQPGSCWPQPIIRRVDHGLADCMGRLRAYGNAINAEAAIAFLECAP